MAKPDPQFERRLAAIFQAEAAEHVQRMQACLADLDGAGGAQPGAPTTQAMFRAAHSLKGAARAVGQQQVEAVCHAAESLLAAVQRGRLAWCMEIGDALHEMVAALQQSLALRGGTGAQLAPLVARLERLAHGPAPRAAPAPPPAASPAPQPPPAAPPEVPAAAAPATATAPAATVPSADATETVRVPVARLAGLLHQVEELVAAKLQAGLQLEQLDALLASCAALRPATLEAAAMRHWQQHEAALRGLKTSAAREQRQLAASVDALLADVKKTLLLPVGSLRPFLVATVRELARSQQKEVELRVRGEAVEMDRQLLQQLREPLVHLLRNAIGHGLEPARERLAAGKPARGLIDVEIGARGAGRVEIRVADDGAGVDTARLAQAARALQLPVSPDAAPAELLPLMFGPGVSTAARLTQVAGRGVGLAIVRETVERMGGTISVASTPGQGTTFTILLTTSLAAYRAVEVQSAGRSFLLPTARVERGLRLAPGELRSVAGQQSVALGEQDLPLASLAGLLGLPAPAVAREGLPCLVLAAGDRRIALAVDAIRGEGEVLGKPVDGAAAQSPVVAGAAVLAGGGMAPILNVPELVRIALREGGRGPLAQVTVAARPRGRSVLLAEDSITSRTLLKNILELAGHRVAVAVDGADALAKLRAGSYEVVVSDVEMPRLDGIGLTRAIRHDPALAHLPVVLVTSLASPADRERGAEAGANAYLVKSSFDQGNLLQAIAELA